MMQALELISGVYKIQEINSGKVYIGASVNVSRRLLGHKSSLRTGKHINKGLQKDFNLFGECSFVFEKIIDCEIASLTEKELELIESHKSKNPLFGYNIHGKANLHSCIPKPSFFKCGEKYGRLTFIKQSQLGSSNWNMLCDCGIEVVKNAAHVKYGMVRSCGCLAKDVLGKSSITHGMSKTREYNIWCKMRARCNNKKDHKYPCYGGRGISVCDRWNDFVCFFEDMGNCPNGYSIERKNNDGNYEPSNCCWADSYTQSQNKRNTFIVKLNDKKMSFAEAIRTLGISVAGAASRISINKETHQQAVDWYAQGNYRKRKIHA